ncbi:hypothetical protein AYO20_07730 [Fonsecaea nubica]|uniref:C2H2-type domain-containing protein n=1 Tax=Fonsecaea nubica TaxID=856822 RepID=A0A178CU39_9EURO|nr:hypothetical protein AYO20_07730 [Fonsecaea nubica]OAL32774.1 hypothetical protein AYO20_07730 [Fonsecaea nubica]
MASLANMDIDEFDSDDEDFAQAVLGSQPVVHRRYAKAGEDSLLSMIENQFVDRVESKQAYKNIDFLDGTVGSAYMRAKTKNMILGYFKLINHDPAICPSGQIIFRYIATTVKRMKPGSRDKPAPSFRTVLQVWRATNIYLRFQYPDWKENYTSSDMAKIKTYLEEQVTQGNLIKGYWQERNWLGFSVVVRMLTMYIRSTVESGCQNWDIVILHCLGVALTVACSCRPGDVAKSSDAPKGMSCLTWDCVNLQVIADELGEVRNIRAKLILKFTKGHKGSLNDDKTVFFDSLEQGEHSCACTVKLLLVHALRNGFCYGNTISDVLKDALASRGKRIRWKYPDQPVLCSVGADQRLQLGTPAPVSQIKRGVRRMAGVAGILEKVNARDLRRGTARDLAHLSKTFKGVSDNNVAAGLGHTRASLGRGVTDRYAGPVQEDLLTARTKDSFQDRMAPELKKVTYDDILPTVRAQRISTYRINKRLEEDGIDPVDATRQLRQDTADIIRRESIHNGPLKKRLPQPSTNVPNKKSKTGMKPVEVLKDPPTAPPSGHLDTIPTGRQPLRELSRSEMNASQSSTDSSAIDPALFMPSNAPALGMDTTQGPAAAIFEDHTATKPPSEIDLLGARLFEDQQMVDQPQANHYRTVPQPGWNAHVDDHVDGLDQESAATDSDEESEEVDAQQLTALEDILWGSSASERSDGNDAVDLQAQEDFNQQFLALAISDQSPEEGDDDDSDDVSHESPPGPDHQPWLMTGLAWIAHFAAINEFVTSKPLHKMASDEVAKYFPVGNSRNAPTRLKRFCRLGCGSFYWLLSDLDVHQAFCTGPDTEDESDEKLRCDEPGCEMKFTKRGSLVAHKSRIHDFKPMKCQSGCNPEAEDSPVYNTWQEYVRHQKAVHWTLAEPRKCPLSDVCGSETRFTLIGNLNQHLKRVHFLNRAQIDELVERPERRKPLASKGIQCPQANCESTASFDAPGKLRDHLFKKHGIPKDDALRRAEELLGAMIRRPSQVVLKPCPHDACLESFSGTTKLRDHLQKKHSLSRDEAIRQAEELLGAVIRRPPRAVLKPCPHDACLESFSGPAKLRDHLQKKHSLSRDEAIRQAEELLGPVGAKTGRRGPGS